MPDQPRPPIDKVIEKIAESKAIKTNDQLRPKPQQAHTGRGMSPTGTVGTEKTERQRVAEAHNAKIEKKRAEQSALKAERRLPGRMTVEFNKPKL